MGPKPRKSVPKGLGMPLQDLGKDSLGRRIRIQYDNCEQVSRDLRHAVGGSLGL
jgi:hypothetical protein